MAEQSVNVRCSNGEKFTVPLDTDATVQAFKESIAEEAQVPSESQRLIYKGRVLKDDQTLASYGKTRTYIHQLVALMLTAAYTTLPDMISFCRRRS
jgi:ubiquilin